MIAVSKIVGHLLGMFLDSFLLMLMLGVINEFATVVPALAYWQVFSLLVFAYIAVGSLARVATNSALLTIKNASL